jgi:hypothetical protein
MPQGLPPTSPPGDAQITRPHSHELQDRFGPVCDHSGMRSLAVLLVAAALVPALAGCGASVAAPSPTAQAQREWIANMSGVIDQLRNDLAQTQLIVATDRAARSALRDESALYALLIAYTDLGGCRHIVASAGIAPPKAARVDRPLAVACSHLEHAASLFSQAATRQEAHPLAAATREARLALPALVQAATALARTSRS